MAELHVIMTGLMCLVERRTEPRKPAVVLLRKVDREIMVAGARVPAHNARIVFRSRGRVAREPLKGRDVFLTSGRRRGLDVQLASFIPVGRELAEPSPVDPALVAESVGEKRDLLSGRVFLSRGSIRPVQVDAPPDFRSVFSNLNINLTGGFLLEEGGRAQEFSLEENRPVANGLVFTTEVEADGGLVSIRVGDKLISTEPIGDFGGLQEQFVVWILNIPSGPNALPSDRDHDPDFHLLYDFLSDSVNVRRFVPRVARRPANPRGEGAPPGECVKGRAFA